MICLHITRIHVLRRAHGPDIVSIEVALPGPTPLDENLSLQFRAVRGTGREYAEKNFPGTPVEETVA